jgi:hypothetical protein
VDYSTCKQYESFGISILHTTEVRNDATGKQCRNATRATTPQRNGATIPQRNAATVQQFSDATLQRCM